MQTRHSLARSGVADILSLHKRVGTGLSKGRCLTEGLSWFSEPTERRETRHLLTDLATEVLDDAAAVERNAGLRLWKTTRGGNYDDLRERYVTFSSETFIQAYLEPEYQPGCGSRGHDRDCLCDVKLGDPVPLTHAPLDFVGVTTAEELLEVAANIWMHLDLLPSTQPLDDRLTEGLIERVEKGQLDDMMAAIRGGCSLAEAKRLEPTLRRQTFMLIRSAFGIFRPRLPKERILELARAQMPTDEIVATVKEEAGLYVSPQTIAKFRREHNIPRPRPKYRRAGRRPESDKLRVYELRDRGLSHREIAAEIGCSHKYVGDVLLRRPPATMGGDGGST